MIYDTYRFYTKDIKLYKVFSLIFKARCFTTESGRWDSNPQQTGWKPVTLPLSYFRRLLWCSRWELNPHTFRWRILNPLRLPIPPQEHLDLRYTVPRCCTLQSSITEVGSVNHRRLISVVNWFNSSTSDQKAQASEHLCNVTSNHGITEPMADTDDLDNEDELQKQIMQELKKKASIVEPPSLRELEDAVDLYGNLLVGKGERILMERSVFLKGKWSWLDTCEYEVLEFDPESGRLKLWNVGQHQFTLTNYKGYRDRGIVMKIPGKYVAGLKRTSKKNEDYVGIAPKKRRGT